MELVGEFLSLPHESALYAYFRRHWTHFFPALGHICRTTFTRQAANLCWVKARLWQALLARFPHDPTDALVDSFALPVCQWARASRCRRFRGEAAYGYDHLTRRIFYGLRMHVRLCWPGVITQFELAAGNIQELEVAADLADGTQGLLIGDRNYWSSKRTAQWAEQGVTLLAPYRNASRDSHPRLSARLSRVRYRIDTVFGQLVERWAIKRVWARDTWHLANRVLRKVLMHTLALWLNLQGHRPLFQFAQLVV